MLDEPTNHLDIHYQIRITELIAQQKKTVLAVFHDLNLAARYCDYLYLVKDGKPFAQGAPQDILSPDLIHEVFRVDADLISHEGSRHLIYKGSVLA